MDLLALAQHCAPKVDVPIVFAIGDQESKHNFNAIGVNTKGVRLPKQPRNYGEAVTTAKQLIAAGVNIDMGFGQINSSNLKWLGLSVEQVYEPCTNLTALQTVLMSCFQRGTQDHPYKRLQQAFSCYNTGNNSKGFSNGYVQSVSSHVLKYTGYSAINPAPASPVAPLAKLPTQGNALAAYANALQQQDLSQGAAPVASIPVAVITPVAENQLSQLHTNNAFGTPNGSSNDVFSNQQHDVFSNHNTKTF